jgi:hypothetical protein
MSVTVYKSTDASAPVLTGIQNSLIDVLDAVLVNGYGAKSAAGWTKPYTGTYRAVYRMNPTGSTGFYLNVADDQPNGTTTATANGREAQVRGFEVKTAQDSATTVTGGTGPFPTVAGAAGGIVIRKSATNDATARPWVIVADDKTFYLFTFSGDFTGWSGFAFGDFYSLKTSDLYRCIIAGRIVANSGSAVDDRLDNLSALGAVAIGHYVPRLARSDAATPILLPINVGKHGNGAHSQATLFGLAPYPNPPDNGVQLSRVWLHEPGLTAIVSPSSVIRGRLRGFWHWLHPVGANVQDGDTIAGAGDLVGKTFLIVKPTVYGTGLFVLETSGTWETSA